MSGRGGLAAPRFDENGINGNGASSARARRRRRTSRTKIATTTINVIAAPAANTTVLYSSTRYRIWENSMALSRLAASPIDAPRLSAGPGRSHTVRQAQCDPRTHAKARPSNQGRQVRRRARMNLMSGDQPLAPRPRERYLPREAKSQSAARRDDIGHEQVERANAGRGRPAVRVHHRVP